MVTLRELYRHTDDGLPIITGITIPDGDGWLQLNEGKWVSGRYLDNIRIDRPTHLAGDNQGRGQIHGHVHDRKGNEIVAVNLDGSGSHGAKGRLHPDDAAALVKRGFKIKPGGIVEFFVLGDHRFQILLG